MSLGSIPVAEDYVKQAKKASKGSWFSSPEYEIAAQLYEKAGNLYFSAKSHEAAGKIAEKKLEKFEVAGAQYRIASDLFLATENMPDKAAELMGLAGRMFEFVNIDEAIKLHLNSISIYENENRGRFATDQFRDNVFYNSDECNAASGLLDAYKKFDQELLDNALKNPSLLDLNSQIRNVIYTLTVPGFSKNVLGIDSTTYRNSVSINQIRSDNDDLIEPPHDSLNEDFDDSLL
ncbi:hypothetical protein BB560_003232 [Smittium megazygosporum]|uniref:Gamma-soluble NSF attachment protein n=1 Tax=Smittium megazygosporum TaxID=133381 RepID=A0A2T9ZCK1_9FUNG|nr:hypothetical protein BB560_003232 [Smittium megazygosporum]